MNNMGKLKQISVTITSALLIVVLAACGGGNEEGSEMGEMLI
ncbi:hypothetical protein [Bacillus sp. JCM 19034]|nr:hypothetical protein [Bacillus sp. JCM 19034]